VRTELAGESETSCDPPPKATILGPRNSHSLADPRNAAPHTFLAFFDQKYYRLRENFHWRRGVSESELH
jgi:hypothetical protein